MANTEDQTAPHTTSHTKAEGDRSRTIGSEHVNGHTVTNKVLEDIDFLRDRIMMIESQKVPNSVILNTYKKMLESREAVLGWLEENEVICSVNPATTADDSTKRAG